MILPRVEVWDPRTHALGEPHHPSTGQIPPFKKKAPAFLERGNGGRFARKVRIYHSTIRSSVVEW